MNWVNAMLLDRVGRIKLMIIGMTGAALAVACETAIVARFAGTDNAVGNGFGIFFLFVFITFFASGMDALFIFVPLACVIVIWRYFPETNGLSLEEIGMLFGDEVAEHPEELSSKFNAGQNMAITGVEMLSADAKPESMKGHIKVAEA
ncbi:hypothetical protein QQX98_004360 [Neonectria punicea]|uniref:Major facilitator superfamily (MFS) profile domain-containing protein n=1 Tax=Neonectria punicea TaxID=979145 RepID=A0ABR1H9I9_9HYPO